MLNSNVLITLRLGIRKLAQRSHSLTLALGIYKERQNGTRSQALATVTECLDLYNKLSCYFDSLSISKIRLLLNFCNRAQPYRLMANCDVIPLMGGLVHK